MSHSMTPQQPESLPPIVQLKYKPGETIIKGGDYGISIYYIVKGKAEIYLESGEKEISITRLGVGEIIGEMVFLLGDQTRRSASVKAVDYTVLEAWHPKRISEEYGNMPFVVRYMANQIVRRLKRMNRLIIELETRKEDQKKADPWASRREFYRKAVDIEGFYYPEKNSILTMPGRIKDISKTGLRLEVSEANSYRCSHQPGDEFFLKAILPNGKKLEVRTKIVRLHEPPAKGMLALGMRFQKMDIETNKVLGFFLMP
jgi:CRP-like cAMP-binding protein